jgi:hypothetical protein
MRKQTALLLIVIAAVVTMCLRTNAADPNTSPAQKLNIEPKTGPQIKPVAGKKTIDDMTKAMEQSIVYLKTAFYGYEQGQPWKNKDLAENWACGIAVGKNQVLTTAWNVANLSFVKALRYSRNEFINAKIKLVDYESNLCLIELDPNGLGEPLKPLVFSEKYLKGDEVDSYWLAADNRMYSGRGYLDRTSVDKTTISYEKRLHYRVANASNRTGMGQVYCMGSDPIGIACWSNDNKECGLVPAEIINRFLTQAAGEKYKGFGSIGFKFSDLLNPAMRSFLKMPPTVKTGIYVTDVYTIGTGSDVLKKADVILSIDSNSLDSRGSFEHPKYGTLNFSYLITSRTAGEKVPFEIWRDGEKKQLEVEVKSFRASDMLVPYHEFDHQPEYIITDGFVFQKLTREYLAQLGKDWEGKVPPHLFHYYSDMSFKPSAERSDIVVLSYVLPTNLNLGYHDLQQMVVKTFNGMTIRSMKDVLTAQKLNPDSKYDVIEFEMDAPTVVIDRGQLQQADAMVGKGYGISKLVNVEQ